MKLAIMQPYFFPYIGYWQLIHAVDVFVLLDDVQYIRHGWINRNRILHPGGGWQYILVPLHKHSNSELIRNVRVHSKAEWKKKIVGQLEHYRKKTRYFDQTIEIVSDALRCMEGQGIAALNFMIMTKVCRYLSIESKIILSSEQGFDYTGVNDAGEWALRISEQMGANEYINPLSGARLFSPQKFEKSAIMLRFLKPSDITYKQYGTFEPWLSIIDVLMFNGVEETKNLITHYALFEPTLF